MDDPARRGREEWLIRGDSMSAEQFATIASESIKRINVGLTSKPQAQP